MVRYCAVFILWAGAFAQERSLPNPKILKWQAEAQARERAVNRRVDTQLEKARANQPVPQANHNSRNRRDYGCKKDGKRGVAGGPATRPSLADLSPCVVGRPVDRIASTRSLESLYGATFNPRFDARFSETRWGGDISYPHTTGCHETRFHSLPADLLHVGEPPHEP